MKPRLKNGNLKTEVSKLNQYCRQSFEFNKYMHVCMQACFDVHKHVNACGMDVRILGNGMVSRKLPRTYEM